MLFFLPWLHSKILQIYIHWSIQYNLMLLLWILYILLMSGIPDFNLKELKYFRSKECLSLLTVRRYSEMRTITAIFKLPDCLGQCQMLNQVVQAESCKPHTGVLLNFWKVMNWHWKWKGKKSSNVEWPLIQETLKMCSHNSCGEVPLNETLVCCGIKSK